MANTNNKQANGLISNAFGVAKKFSRSGLDLINHVAPDSVSKVTQAFNVDQAIEGVAKTKSPIESKKYENPQQMLREHLPSVSRQLLGRHFNTLNNVSHFISPNLSDKVADYFFDHLNHLSNEMSSVDTVLDEAGVRDLEELTQDVDRSKRISQALGEQNKWIASIQGAFSGATGIVGTAVDIPASLLLALRTIYQVGRSYGFDLSKDTDQDIVLHIFRQIDLGLIAEKQTLLLALKALSSTLRTQDVSQLQMMLGSNNDTELLKKFLYSEDGQAKWTWLNRIPKVSLLEQVSKLTPLAGAGIGAVYSRRFVEDVNQKAQEVFLHARQYLIQHRDSSLSALAAYEKSVELILQATPKLLESLHKADTTHAEDVILDQNIKIEGNDNISQVKVVKKQELSAETAAEKEKMVENTVSEGLEALVKDHVEPIEEQQVQQPALRNEPEEFAEHSPEDMGVEVTSNQADKPKDTRVLKRSMPSSRATSEQNNEDVTKDADPLPKKD